MTKSRPSWQRRFLITGVVTIAMLLAGEGTLRLWAYFFRHPYQRFDPHLRMIRLVPNYHEMVDGKVLDIDSLGLRGPEVKQEKPPHVTRIIMLGDSVTFGRAGDDCHYPGVLRHVLDEKYPGDFEIINGAVEGYNSEDALRLLENELVGLSPDMVTVFIGWNDMIKQDPVRPLASAAEKRLAYAVYDIYLIKLWRKVIYYYLRRALLSPSSTLNLQEEAAFRTYVPIVYRDNLERIIAVARKAGSKVVLFTLPSVLRPNMTPKDVGMLYFPYFTYNVRKFQLLYEQYNQTIRAVGRENDLPVVDLQEPLRGYESKLFMDTAHLECEGYQILGRYLARVLPDLLEHSPHLAKAN